MVPGKAGVRWLGLLCGLLLAGCGSTPEPGGQAGENGLAGYYKLGTPYQIAGRWYYPAYDPSYAAEGIASWYGEPFHGRKTANGEVFDRGVLSAAHPTLPLPSIVRVTNLANQRELELRVNDRGPFVGDRVIDLSQAAARALGFERRGTTPVRVEFVRLADANGKPPQPTVRVARAQARAPAVAHDTVAARDIMPAAAAGPDRTQACMGAGFIQVGAFIEAERALRLASQLDAAVLVPVSAEPPSRDPFTRVRLGPMPDLRQAEDTLRWLHRIGHVNAYLIEPDATSSVAC